MTPASLPPARPPSSFAIDVPDGVGGPRAARRRQAFEQIYRSFERPVFNLALRIAGDREEASEVLQETMLKVIDHIREFRGGAPFWGWLRQIAVNEALMQLRRGRRQSRELSDDDEDGFGEDAGPLPPAAADAAQVHRALGSLPSATRSVLWLYHAEGYTHEEIAALMQRTPSFSKSQLARGTRRLRALLQRRGIRPCMTVRTAAHLQPGARLSLRCRWPNQPTTGPRSRRASAVAGLPSAGSRWRRRSCSRSPCRGSCSTMPSHRHRFRTPPVRRMANSKRSMRSPRNSKRCWRMPATIG